jgi:cytochrome c-type biogenesis protein CcmH/NrfG
MDAVVYLEEVLRLSPGRMDVLVRLADIEAQRRHAEKAEMYYRKILELAPQCETALVGLVGILTAQKRGEEAVEYIETYLESYPNNKRVRFLLARTYEDMGWYEVAIMKYEELVSLFPKEPEAHLGLGRTLYSFITLKNGTDYDKAIYALKAAAQALPADPQPDYLIGNLYQARNMRELAVDSWKSALQKATDKKLRSRLQSLIANAAR